MNENTLTIGTVLLGKSYTYTIQKVLGQGTFGITYLATTRVKVAGALGELETVMQVAIKEFFMRDINGREENTVTTGSKGGIYANYRKKFAREAENLSKLHHPNIVKVLEYFEANNTTYYAMEYVEGGSLDSYITEKKGLPEAECVKYVRQIGEALAYMHAHKMLHLDLKPGNVMLRQNKDAVLIDFGLSKQYDEKGEPESSTSVGSGTPGYAPVEQANYHEGKGFPVTMDVYALGATMYKMLVGVRPPEAPEILNEGFPAYELQQRGVSDALIAVIAKAMAAMKKERVQSVEAFLKLLGNEEGTTMDEEAKKSEDAKANEETIHEEPVAKEEIHPQDPIVHHEAEKVTGKANDNDQRSKKNKLILGIIAALVVAIAAVCFTFSGGKSVEEIYAEASSAYQKQDYATAAKLYQEAAEQGHVEAQTFLALCYANGSGVAKDITQAVEWWAKAAEQGNTNAQTNLAVCYYNGNGVAKDIAKAIEWCTKAAEQGDAEAQDRLAWLYEHGEGVTKDLEKATEWYKKAAEQGNENAKSRLQKLEEDRRKKSETPKKPQITESKTTGNKTTESKTTGNSRNTVTSSSPSKPQKKDNTASGEVDQMPEFPNGGTVGLMQYLSQNVQYPEISQENGVQGRVMVQFVVETDGSITNAKVIRGVDPYLDREALRVVNAMPKWKPGKSQGKTVRTVYTIPVTFRLE